VIAGNFGDNIINGRGGDGQALPDTLIGLAGNDTYGVFSEGDVVREVAGQGQDVVYASTSYQLRAGTEIEALAAINGQATDGYTLRGNEVAQTVVGNAGANVLDGRGGNDTLVGLAGADSSPSPPRSARATSTRSRTSRPRTGSGSPPTSSPPSPRRGGSGRVCPRHHGAGRGRPAPLRPGDGAPLLRRRRQWRRDGRALRAALAGHRADRRQLRAVAPVSDLPGA
jgi:Ca2+-binding RTX toxin-like protein